MSGFRPVAVYGLTIAPGEDPVPAFDYDSYPATFRLSMAALDPFAKPVENETTEDVKFTGATLKIIRIPNDDEDSEDEDDEDEFDSYLDDEDEDEDDEEDDEEDEDDEDVNGGPSDPSKSKKAKQIAALKKLVAEAQDSMDLDETTKLTSKAKGKAKVANGDITTDDVDGEDDDEEDDEDDEDEGVFELPGPEEFVLCTLDPTKNYQQTLDITINEYETVYFQVSGTHSVYLTGNILVPDEGEGFDDDDDEDEDEDEYDLSPDEDELEMPLDDEDEEDLLDGMDDPRVTELDDEDEAEAPKLVSAKKGKNKRSAPDSADTSMVDDAPATASVDEILAKTLKPAAAADTKVNGDVKLTKSQRKKLKANAGHAVEAPTTSTATEDAGVKVEDLAKASPKADKKVQFSKSLIQGPTSSAATTPEAKSDNKKAAEQKSEASAKGALGPKVVNGVTIDDKKLGHGPAAKKGNKVAMRYIGKLADSKKQFDANKKGKPFTFNLGTGEVIKGWDIGVVGMTVGGERRITIPANLAYGSKAQPGIPANSTLVFDVKLLSIN